MLTKLITSHSNKRENAHYLINDINGNSPKNGRFISQLMLVCNYASILGRGIWCNCRAICSKIAKDRENYGEDFGNMSNFLENFHFQQTLGKDCDRLKESQQNGFFTKL